MQLVLLDVSLRKKQQVACLLATHNSEWTGIFDCMIDLHPQVRVACDD